MQNMDIARADMAAAIAQELRRRGIPDQPERVPKRLPEGVKQALLGAAGGVAWGLLLGLGLMGVV